VSCPNLEAGGLEIGANPRAVERVVRAVTGCCTIPVIVKLTPNVTSIAEIARAAEAGGAAAVTAINTVVGLGVDLRHRRPLLGNGTGGASGPAIKAIALRSVWEISEAVSVPVIGVGGIATAGDALQFLLVGAAAVQVGSATFTRPDAMVGVIDGIEKWMAEEGIPDVAHLAASFAADVLDKGRRHAPSANYDRAGLVGHPDVSETQRQ
jgi:dihydroorotate dehydrogenase (NAD+) catalytic subunit